MYKVTYIYIYVCMYTQTKGKHVQPKSAISLQPLAAADGWFSCFLRLHRSQSSTHRRPGFTISRLGSGFQVSVSPPFIAESLQTIPQSSTLQSLRPKQCASRVLMGSLVAQTSRAVYPQHLDLCRPLDQTRRRTTR